MTMISSWQKGHVPNPTEASMNSDHDIEVTEETPAEALESASETTLDHAAAAAVEAADLSDDDEDGDDEEGEEGDHAEAATLSDDDEDGEAEEVDDKEEAA
ncbi:ATPase [Mesorhizobium sp. M0293]|uniref:ATPase n=1 Tax=unclassified Mesorhizobium TaxID=325217 RepID=UPI0033390BDB